MHGLGVGRGLTEPTLHDDYQTLDLHARYYQRIIDNRPTPSH